MLANGHRNMNGALILVVVPFDFHRSRAFLPDALDSGHAQAKLRIVKRTLPAIGICESCNSRFKSSKPSEGMVSH